MREAVVEDTAENTEESTEESTEENTEVDAETEAESTAVAVTTSQDRNEVITKVLLALRVLRESIKRVTLDTQFNAEAREGVVELTVEEVGEVFNNKKISHGEAKRVDSTKVASSKDSSKTNPLQREKPKMLRELVQKVNQASNKRNPTTRSHTTKARQAKDQTGPIDLPDNLINSKPSLVKR